MTADNGGRANSPRGEWSFLTNHARVMLCIAHDPGIRLRDIAATLDITERTAFGIVNDLTSSGYVVKERDGRRNRYRIEHRLPLREPTAREHTVGEVLALLADFTPMPEPAAGHETTRSRRPRPSRT
jgi:DNA-binding MarR family transcriptional regulator